MRNFQIAGIILFLVFLGISFTGQGQNFPPISFVIEDSAATQGYYFISPYTNSPSFNFDLPHLILDRFGRIVYYRVFPGGSIQVPTVDFKIQPDGRMSYFDISNKKFYLMDSTFTIVDSIASVNGFETDEHDIQIIAGNHYLLFGQETRIMNLSSYHWFGFNHTSPGSANAEVLGVVIQEFDENKALVWEWKGHDHYQFGDVDPVYLFNPNRVDWTHANAVERDNDGNILLSLRHFNEITKINHSTGNIIWRMGGKQNQFTFPNDPIRFTGQHDIRRVSSTSISMFDNGQYTNPPVGRALEYVLDESNKIATLAWEYIYNSSLYSIACGNHQYIGNGNHLVDFGSENTTGFPWMVVVKPDMTKVVEVSMPNGTFSYRAFNYPTLPWQLHRPNVECQKIGTDYFLVAESGHPGYKWSNGATTSSIQITSTGEYWVFVPYGTGYISSEHIDINDMTNPCLYTSVSPRNIPAEPSLACISGTPANQLRIIFDLPANSNVTMSIFTLLGTQPRGPMHGYYPAGNNEITMDISSLGRGIYFLTMVVENTRIVRKFIIQ